MKWLGFLIFFSLLSFSTYSLSESDPYFLELKQKVASGDSVKIILELDINSSIITEKSSHKRQKILALDSNSYQTNLKLNEYKKEKTLKQNKIISDLQNINSESIKKGSTLPYLVLEVNVSTIDDLLSIPEIKSVREDMLLNTTLSYSLSQIGVDVVFAQNYSGQGQSIAVLDTGFDITHPMLAPNIIDEACYSLNLCPGGVPSLTGPGSSINCSGFLGCDHGTHVAGIIAGNNGSGFTGVAKDATLITINVFSDVGGPQVQAYSSDILSGLERVYNISGFYNISAVSMSLGGGSYTSNCDAVNPAITSAIEALRSIDIPTIVASGNDGYTNSISFPACISSAFAVGSVEDDGTVSGFSNSDDQLDFLAPGGSILSAIPGGGYATLAGTSMATPHISGAWAVMKSIDPTLTTEEIYDALASTSSYVTDSKSLVTSPLINLNIAASSVIIPNFTGGENIIDISMFENIYENVRYDPLSTGSGLYYDLYENQINYEGNGSIVISNVHPNISVENIQLNFKNIGSISNVSFLSGRNGSVDRIEGNYLHLFIPDLGPGQSTIFRYDLNVSTISPPLNFTTSYSENRILAGEGIKLYDTVSNSLDLVTYDDTCIYNISIIQQALNVNVSGSIYDFIFDNTSLLGGGSSNVVMNNKTLQWDVNALSCLNSGNSSSINYDLFTPSQIINESSYDIINSTMSFNYNSTFSNLQLNKVSSSLSLDLKFTKNLIDTINQSDGTWEIFSTIQNPYNVGVNLKQVSLWVSQRDGTGTGFTNPGLLDNDSVSSQLLLKDYYPHSILNLTTNYTNFGDEWFFNYSYIQSPIVWMNLNHDIIDNDVQIRDTTLSIGESFYYTKELYVQTGYFLRISKNITRLGDQLYEVEIFLRNIGPSQTPQDQIVVVYNFLHSDFTLESPFLFSSSPWYNSDSTNETLLDAIYNGVMFQYALVPQTSFNTSLDAYLGSFHQNNTWSVRYNISGTGEFNFDDLFILGVDPLAVGEVGGSQAIQIEGEYSKSFNYALVLIMTSLLIFSLIIFT